MRFGNHIKAIEYEDKVGLFNIADSKEYVLLKDWKYREILSLMVNKEVDSTPTLRRMMQAGWFEDNTKNMDFDGQIELVVLELTHRCNAGCTHCYMDAKQRMEGKDISFEEYIEFIKPFLGMVDAKHIGITGGEPTVVGDLYRIIEDILKDTDIDLFLYTNGLQLDDELLLLLGKYRKRVGIQISLDGATSETNDRIRGYGTYDRIMSTLERVRDSDIERVTVKYTVTPNNQYEYEEFCALVQKMGFTPSVSTYKQSGRGVSCYSYSSVCDALSRLSSLVYGALKTSAKEDPYLIFSDRPCGLGRKKSAVIDPELNLLDCASIRREMGNIKSNPEMAIEKYSLVDFPTVDELPQCRDCEVRYACHGGCRSIPYLAGDIRGKQPYCSLYRDWYRRLIWKDAT